MDTFARIARFIRKLLGLREKLASEGGPVDVGRRSTTADDAFFREWIMALPAGERPRFSRDGIVDEAAFARERRRVLFIVLEPNTDETGAYSQFLGCDLREVWRTTPQRKEFNKNVARWSGLLLDGPAKFWSPTAEESRAALRRVAVINLKKVAGGGARNLDAIRAFASQHEDRLIEQVRRIAPDVVFACGADVANLMRRIGTHSKANDGRERWCGALMFCGNHPSLRPKDAPAAFLRLHEALPSIVAALRP